MSTSTSLLTVGWTFDGEHAPSCSSDGQDIKLWRYLPESRVRRRPRDARRRQGRRFRPELSILRRPDTVRNRQQLGHWDCDLIQFRKKFGQANLSSFSCGTPQPSHMS
jgi:IS30 family transposase